MYRRKRKDKTSSSGTESTTTLPDNPIVCDIYENIKFIKKSFGDSTDLELKMIQKNKFAILYISGITNLETINEQVLGPLQEEKVIEFTHISALVDILPINNVTIEDDLTKLLYGLSQGRTVILSENNSNALLVETKQIETRGIEENSTQAVIRGPKESFSESLDKNTALLRARFQSPLLQIKTLTVGEVTKTKVSIAYIENIVNIDVLNEILERISNLDVDAILESSYIDAYIKDNDMTMFPTMLETERPDVVAGEILEGRVAILVDGTPFAIIAPAVFIQFFHAAEDYYQHQYIASFLRLIRFSAFFLSLLAPSIYIAILAHHEGLIPTPLLISILAQREVVPFPLMFETLLMEIIFEVLREAGIRMPKAIGNALSIVGALIIGQAAVEAGLVAASTIIIVAITAISSFSIPFYSMAAVTRLLRFIFIFAASFMGLYGITVAFILILLHMCSLRSFGMPYLSPLSPLRKEDLKDSVLRSSTRSLKRRPFPANKRNRQRIKVGDSN